MHRRSFLQTAVTGVAACGFAATTRPRELSTEVAVIGGGTGGCAAALGALREGRRVVMSEECRWIGGQLTSQLVPPDEHPWMEMFGGTRSYRNYREAVRAYYRSNFPITEEARSRTPFNPGGGSVSGLTHEPKVSLAVLETMLAPYLASGQLVLLTEFRPVAADFASDRLRAVTVEHTQEKHRVTISAPYFVDATEQGDLLPLAKCEFITGFESRAMTGEASAPETAQPANIQAFTVCFAAWMLNGVLVTFLSSNQVFNWGPVEIGWLLGIPVLTGSIFRLPAGMLTELPMMPALFCPAEGEPRSNCSWQFDATAQVAVLLPLPTYARLNMPTPA